MTSVTIHFLECGQGDTTLLRIQDKWVLIDCNLPSKFARNRFFVEVNDLKISRLDAVFLTHPHDDHCRGMLEIIKHFTTGGRSIGYFCDGGLNPRLVKEILQIKSVPSAVTTYVELYRMVFNLDKQKVFEYYRCDKNTNPVISSKTDFSLFPIGPNARVYDASVIEALEKDKSAVDLNELSLILFLEAKVKDALLDVVLAADAGGNQVNDALLHLIKRKQGVGAVHKLDVVKIPHHGSLASHKDCMLCKCIKVASNSVAVVSSGTKFAVLPDRNVMQEYMTTGWNVLLTTKRVSPPAKMLAMSVISKTRKQPVETQKQDIAVSWNSTSLSWTPKRASVRKTELSSYRTALKA